MRVRVHHFPLRLFLGTLLIGGVLLWKSHPVNSRQLVLDLELPDRNLDIFARSIVLGESDIAIKSEFATFLWGFDTSISTNWLMYIWSDLSPSERDLALYRFGYNPNTTLPDLLKLPQPKPRVELPIFRNGKPRELGI